MDNTYIFFDVECANCFDGAGKMCSFGYAVTDADFNVIEADDLVMNPQAEFDWYLFSPKNRCPLAYSKEYFRHQHSFDAYYKQIKTLLTAPLRKVIGFSAGNDVGFVITACERYSLPVINFAAYDSEPILNAANGAKKGLEAWNEFYHIDTSAFHAHRSSDDAMMTMLAVKALCAAKKTDIETLLAENRSALLSVEKVTEQQAERAHRREVNAKIANLYGKKNKTPRSTVFAGEKFAVSFKIAKNAEETLKIAEFVYDNGGMFFEHLKDAGTLIVEDGAVKASHEGKTGSADVHAITKSELYGKVSS